MSAFIEKYNASVANLFGILNYIVFAIGSFGYSKERNHELCKTVRDFFTNPFRLMNKELAAHISAMEVSILNLNLYLMDSNYSSEQEVPKQFLETITKIQEEDFLGDIKKLNDFQYSNTLTFMSGTNGKTSTVTIYLNLIVSKDHVSYEKDILPILKDNASEGKRDSQFAFTVFDFTAHVTRDVWKSNTIENVYMGKSCCFADTESLEYNPVLTLKSLSKDGMPIVRWLNHMDNYDSDETESAVEFVNYLKKKQLDYLLLGFTKLYSLSTFTSIYKINSTDVLFSNMKIQEFKRLLKNDFDEVVRFLVDKLGETYRKCLLDALVIIQNNDYSRSNALFSQVIIEECYNHLSKIAVYNCDLNKILSNFTPVAMYDYVNKLKIMD